MFDELFDMFDRDGRDGRNRGGRSAGERQGGVRGFFARLFGGRDDADDPRYDEREGRDYHGEAGARGDGRRRRDRDFEWGDDD